MNKFNLVLLLLLGSSALFAATDRVIVLDSMTDSARTKVWYPPGASDTLVGESSTQTLTNKTMSGASNTFSAIPVTAIGDGSVLSGSNTGDITIGQSSGLYLNNQVLSLQLASGTSTGGLSNTDWTTFNNKVPTTTTVNGHALSANVTVSAAEIEMSKVGSATWTTVQDMQTVFHSAGWISGGEVTSNGDGTVAVAAGTGLIRIASSATALLRFTDWSASASLALTDAVENWIYVSYNGGAPTIVASTSATPDNYQYIELAKVFRSGTTLHINTTVKETVGNHAGLMIDFNKAIMPYARESGASISATGTRNFALTAGVFWEGLTRFSVNAFDSSNGTGDNSGRFTYVYNNGAGWTEVANQTQIDNTQYNTGGALATLSNNRYGVHWVYEETDNNIVVVYGVGDYTLTEAQAAQPDGVPERLSASGFLVGKIIIQKSAASFTETLSAFAIQFTSSAPPNHNDLGNIQGGTTAQYYHLTSAQHTIATQAATSSVSGYLSNTDWSTFNNKASYTPNQYGVAVSGTTSVFNIIAPDASTYKVLTSGGTGANPTWSMVTANSIDKGSATTGQVMAVQASGSVAWQSPTSGTWIQEQPTGSINGLNSTFYLTHTPLSSAATMVFLDGRVQIQGSTVVMSGSVLTTNFSPTPSQQLYIIYQY